MFQVTTLLGAVDEATTEPPPPSAENVEKLRDDVAAAGATVAKLKAAAKEEGGDKAAVKPAVDEMLRLRSQLEEMEKASRKVGGLFRTADGKVDYAKDFFGEPTFLTVSGQLNVETYACAMSSVYTFGPTFRAENSNTTRHLAEFWMIEPEIAFADLADDMRCAEDYVQYCLRHVLEHCRGDLEFISKMYDKEALERVKHVSETPFGRVSYTEAIDLLEKAVADGKTFVYPVEWGIDLATEHERFLAEEIFKRPVIVYNYPKDIKAFYMRLNEDNKTVAAMDVLVPKVGELIGGSQREERIDNLEARMREIGLDPEEYEWYLDLRRYGTVVHSGFGLGFERLVLFCTGMENIRDVIPFPRWPGNCK
jgi:asparaginyl-tRNA synthetase